MRWLPRLYAIGNQLLKGRDGWTAEVRLHRPLRPECGQPRPSPKGHKKFPSGLPHIPPADPGECAIRRAPSLSRMPTLVRQAASSAPETEFEDLESCRSRGSQRAGPRWSVTPNRQVPPNWSYQRRLVPAWRGRSGQPVQADLGIRAVSRQSSTSVPKDCLVVHLHSGLAFATVLQI